VLTAAVRNADLSHGAVLAGAGRLRAQRQRGIAPEPVLGPPAGRTPQATATVLRPRPDAPKVLEPLAHGVAAPSADEVQAELLG
jgi:hypothetical protein